MKRKGASISLEPKAFGKAGEQARPVALTGSWWLNKTPEEFYRLARQLEPVKPSAVDLAYGPGRF